MEKKDCLIKYLYKKEPKMFPTWQDLNNVAQSALNLQAKEGKPEARRSFELNLLKAKFNLEKVGMLVSFIHPENDKLVCVGFSLCNTKKYDKFDKIQIRAFEYRDFPGLSFKIASGRALKWSMFEWLAISPQAPSVPVSITKDFKKFVLRTQKYYKDKQLPKWVTLFLERQS